MTMWFPPEMQETVAKALWRFALTFEASAEAAAELAGARPAHRLALAAARRETYGLAWLVVEEEREAAGKDPRRGVARLDRCRRLLLGFQLEQHLGPQMRDLEATVLAYLADALRLTYDHLSAERWLREAELACAAGTGRAEVVALIAETKAGLASCQGRHGAALELLAEAEAQLLGTGFEVRRAEILGRRGVTWLRTDATEQAAATLAAALRLLPASQALGLRLFLLHNLAAAAVRLGRSRRALEILREATPLYERHGHDLLHAQRWWVLGKAQLANGQWHTADASLREAVGRLLDLGFGRSVLLVLLDLAELYLRAGWSGRFIDCESLVCELAERPAVGPFLRTRIVLALQLAWRKGSETRHLELLLCALGR